MLGVILALLSIYCRFAATFIPCNAPIVVTTWNFANSTAAAYDVLQSDGLALDAIERGASVCEEEQCDGTVGYGGSPDEHGETTLDALIMDGKTMNIGAVAALRRIKNAISVARHVLEHTKHSILVGEFATKFALEMGFQEESLTTLESKKLWKKWYNEDNCQPNFWLDVTPDPRQFCGPYKKVPPAPNDKNDESHQSQKKSGRYNHDTIGILAIDKNGNVAAGTSTNGAKFKIPGRVGDSPIPGSGAYADNTVGAAAATGDGDILIRFLPSFLAVEEMRNGASPTQAAQMAVSRVAAYYTDFMGAVITVSIDGRYGAACYGLGDSKFPFVVQDSTQDSYNIIEIDCY